MGKNISELKKAQEQREEALSLAAEAKKLALVGQVAGKMAHDFNNILGTIMGLSEISLMDSHQEKVHENLNLILTQTLRGKNLTKNLVAFAKSQEPKQELLQINEQVTLVIKLMEKDLKNISLTVDLDPDLPHLLADPGMIEHALVNIIQNAIHATSKTQKPQIKIRSYCHNEYNSLEIEDNGCGIPKTYIEKIYEPFFTLKGQKDLTGSYGEDIKGTGYGMANVKKYITQHNGKIQVDSVVGSGTTFTINIPRIDKELSKEEKKEISNEKVHHEKYFLLVEDEEPIADIQYSILTQEPLNHRVDVANNGTDAKALFKKNPYDLVSLDYALSDDVNGMDIYNYIRQTDRKIPIVFISGNIEFLESIEELRQKDPYVDHLSKPCRNVDYVNAINRLLNKVDL